ncbi:MAG: exonuclease subunit SbcD [Flavobacteriaceae bacterium]|nr:exonuclease subunit SbcD [Flavobacteriaceae bacterium]
MKILHTADWHLGKKLDRFSRMDEQIELMNEIVEIAESENVDLVLIAGDLFDTFHPPTEAVDLFYKTLKRLSLNGKRPVIAIAGNHDSPAMIDAPDPLARECGIILIGQPKAIVSPLILEDFKISKTDQGFIELELNDYHYPVRLLHTAFANEVRLKEFFGENKEDELNLSLKNSWKSLADKYCDQKGVNLLMTHLYMNKRGTVPLDEPDGEKPIKIGNADMIYSDAVPPQIQYVALGHLHGHINIGTEHCPVIYSSSPVAYSFSESGQQKSVTIIEAFPDEKVSYRNINLKKGKQLFRKTFTSIDEAETWLIANPETLVEVTIESDTYLKAEDNKRIFQAHNGIVYLIPKIKSQATSETSSTKSIDVTADIQELFFDYFKAKNAGQEPNEEIITLFDEILKS